MISDKVQWIRATADAAAEAGHVWPMMAACEAALESGFGISKLAHDANNLFGMKQHTHPIFGTLTLPTREYLNDQWVVTTAPWVSYPTVTDCFTDRMATLKRLQDNYPHYARALTATDEYTYINEVSRTWSTDPLRADKVTSIYHDFLISLGNSNAEDVEDAAIGEK